MSTDSHPNPTPALSPPVTAAIIAGSVIVILSTALVYLFIYQRKRLKQSKNRDTEASFDANDIVNSYGDHDDQGDIHFRTSTINTALANPATPRASNAMHDRIPTDTVETISERGRSRHRRSLFESTIFRLGHVYCKRAKKEQSMLGTNEMVSIWLDMLPGPHQEAPTDNDVHRMMPRQVTPPQPILRNRAKSMPSMRSKRRPSTEYTEESFTGSFASVISANPPVDAGLGTGITDPRLVPKGSLRIHRHSTDMTGSYKTAPRPADSSNDSDDAETINFPNMLKRAASLRFRRNTTAPLAKSRNPYSLAAKAKRQTRHTHTHGSQSLSYNVFTDYRTSMATQQGSAGREPEPKPKRPIPLRSKSMPVGQPPALPIDRQPNMDILRTRARTTGVSEQEMTHFLLHEYRKSGPLDSIDVQDGILGDTSNKENVQPARQKQSRLVPLPSQHIRISQGIARRNTAVVDGRITHPTSQLTALKRANTTKTTRVSRAARAQ